MTRAADLSLEANVEAGPDVYTFETVDGVVSPDRFRTPELLLLRTLHGANPGDHLSVQANYGVVGVGLRASASSVRLAESSVRRATCCRRNAARNDARVRTTVVADLRRLDAGYDTASYAPESHTPIPVAKQRLADALAALRPGGRLYVAAADRAGRSRFEDCLTDDDRVATRAAACSLRPSDVDARVVTADGVTGVVHERFDRVLCNPPTHAGSGVRAAILGGARRVVAPDGELLLVHHRELNLRPHLRGFGRIRRRAVGEEHLVLSVTH